VTNGNHQALFMKLDPAGNLIVAGRSQNTNGALDYVTLKYAPNGALLWSARHGSGTSDTPRDLAVDTNGNIHVTGTYDTVKYDGNGNLLWTAPYAGRALALGSDGTVHVTGYLNTMFSTVKLAANGTNLWARTLSFAGTNSQSQVITLDATDNVYVAGQANCYPGPPTSYVTYAVVKYALNGAQQYVTSHPGCFELFSSVKGLFLGTDGVLYVAAEQDSDNYHAAGYGPTGEFLWRYALAHGNAIGLGSAAINSKNEIFMTGTYPVRFTTVKVGTNHLSAWERRYGDLGFGGNGGNALVMDATDSVYVTGFSTTATTGKDAVTIKYDTEGTQLWLQRYDGQAQGNDEGKTIAVDAQGSVYVAGYQTVPGGGTEIILIKYGSLQNIAVQTNATVNLQWFGKVGQSYRIQASTTLTNWTDLATVQANSNNIYSFQDTNAPAYSYRFYRSVSP
jgi:hypothetical protein